MIIKDNKIIVNYVEFEADVDGFLELAQKQDVLIIKDGYVTRMTRPEKMDE